MTCKPLLTRRGRALKWVTRLPLAECSRLASASPARSRSCLNWSLTGLKGLDRKFCLSWAKSTQILTVHKMNIRIRNAERITMMLIAVGMSFLMSAAMLLFNVGMTSDFFWIWMKSWALSSAVAYPAALLIIPLARNITARLTR